MIKITPKININMGAIEAKINGAWEKTLPFLSEEVLGDCNQFCKEDTGMLIASSLTHSRPKEGRLIWKTPYARRQYWAIRTAFKDVNPGATWRWCEAAKRKQMAKWHKQAQRLMEMNL